MGPRAAIRALAPLALLVPGLLSAARASAEVPAGAPLPASEYSVQRVCAPPAPGYMSCFALKLLPLTAAARSHTHPLGIHRRHALSAENAVDESAFGFTPEQLHLAYGLPAEAPISQTVGIVDAYNDPTIEADLKKYDEEFKLPECTKANGCFKKVNQEGRESSLPVTEGKWASEISLDVEVTHAVCPNCKIVLVEATSSWSPNLATAENTAASLGATEISNSWGAPEEAGDSSAFNHPGVVIAAAAGDYGYLNWDAGEPLEEFIGFPDYPASSPHVVSVGGTRLMLTAESKWASETIWNDGSTVSGSFGASGGGCSEHFTAQLWQREVPDWSEVGCGTKRASNDVAADADPYTPVAVYNSTPEISGGAAAGWTGFGGTSLASPIIASTFALAGGSGGVSYPTQTLYSHLGTSALHDVTSGSNGRCEKTFNGASGVSGCTIAEEAEQCSSKLACKAASGFDGPAGVGTPDGVAAFTPPPPSVTALEPTEGSTTGGRTVKVKGTDLLGASKVEFGTSQATEVHAVSASELTVKTPAHAAGAVNVTVTTPGGTSTVVAADEYTYVVPPPPTVTAVEPLEGSTAGGRTVKILGTGLEAATEAHFGSAVATEVHEVSPTEITVKAPAHATPEAVNVTVTTPGGTSAIVAADEYTYVVPPIPTVTAVEPSAGSVSGGQTVKIVGAGLEDPTEVHFGSTVATEVHEVSPTEITAKAPAHAAAETVDVTVATAGGTSATGEGDRYTYVALPLPIVTGVSPSQGSIAGGATVRVTGSNLEGVSAVHFGEAAGGEVQVLSASELKVKTPTHAAGTVDVTVTAPGGTSSPSAADHYTFALPTPEGPPATELPGAGSTTLTGSPFGGTYSSVPASNAYSNFNVIGKQVDGRTGAVKLTVAVFHRGTLRWALTFREAGSAHSAHCRGRRGKRGCAMTTVVFGQGTKTVSGAMIISFTVAPGAAAKRALQRALRRRAALSVQASVTYTAIGGSAIAHSASVTVRLAKPSRQRRRAG